jgi:hypothetical protein
MACHRLHADVPAEDLLVEALSQSELAAVAGGLGMLDLGCVERAWAAAF